MNRRTTTAGASAVQGRRHYSTGGTTDGRRSQRDVGAFGRNILRSRGAGGSGG